MSSILILTGCAEGHDESVTRYSAISSTSPQPPATSTNEDRNQWCEPAQAQWDERLGLTVDFEKTQTELTIHYTATNNRPSPVFAINRIQQDTDSALPRERHFVVPRSDGVVEISQRKFIYRSPNCIVPRSMPLPPPLASRIDPGSELSGTIRVRLPLHVLHPEGPSATEYLPHLPVPPYSVSFCLGFSSTAGPNPVDVDGEALYSELAAGPETVACSTPLQIP
ncbi:hypothetical protein ACFU44_08820 [Nocardia rhizosphaerihabitans]|uniref:hypothetical protein n=1 Tax=Nocardia rhizosphaerihabitans TaxID=1691570 RepID=UPI00366BE77F